MNNYKAAFLLTNLAVNLFILADKNSLFKRAIWLMEIFLGHSASQAPVLVQLPNPNSSILATIALARVALSTFSLRQ